ncbi:ATP-dependent helicase, partial [Bacillus mojavensis]|nr:ATP-dependent helicase [Bacillus mojavensis]
KMLDQKEKQAPAIDEHTISILMDRINQVTQNSKANQVVDLIKKIDDKVIIFTEYRATQIYLQWFLQQHGISSVPFRGGF